MDNFIERIANRFSGHEVIKANAEAEAAEMRKLKDQAKQTGQILAQYEACLTDMQKVNLRNSESAGKVQALIDHAEVILVSLKNKVDEIDANAGDEEAVAALNDKITGINEEITAVKESVNGANEKIAGLTDKMTAMTQSFSEISGALTASQNIRNDIKSDLEEAMHKENVKTYRNIQTVLMEEVSKQTETLENDLDGVKKTNRVILVLVIISLLAGLGSVGLMVVQMFL